MTSSNALPLIFYYNGELIDEDRDVRYIGGKTKCGFIPDTIGFIELKNWIGGLLKSYLEHKAFLIKCKYKVDNDTKIAIDVDDDQSLKFVIDQLNPNNCVIAYIVEHPHENIETMPIRTPNHEEGTPAAKMPESKTGRKAGRPAGSKGKEKKEEASSSKEAPPKKRGWHSMKRGKRQSIGPIPRQCGNCGVFGHNKKSCKNYATAPADNVTQVLSEPKTDLPLVVNS